MEHNPEHDPGEHDPGEPEAVEPVPVQHDTVEPLPGETGPPAPGPGDPGPAEPGPYEYDPAASGPGTPPWAAADPPPPPPPPPGTGRRVLRRSIDKRILGGVAAGIADYVEIDPLIVRIVFVALAVLGGSGILLYLAGWLLIPADDTGRAVAHSWLEPKSRPRSLVVIVIGVVLGIIAVSNLFSSGPWWPHWDHGFGGFGFYFGVIALVLAGALLVASGRRDGSPLRWLLVTALVTVVAVVTVAAATVFSVEALSGVPMHGGIGDTQWRPTSLGQVAPRYRLAIGNMVVDLGDVRFDSGTTRITATVGIGHLLVEVPPGPTVSVSAHSGMGDVQVFGQNIGGLSTRRTMVAPGAAQGASVPNIVLDAETGVGQVQVTRS